MPPKRKEGLKTKFENLDKFGIKLAIGILVLCVLVLLLQIFVPNHDGQDQKKVILDAFMFAIALAVVCSMIKFANLPMGGSVTLFSMLFITLIGYWYGPYVGIMTAVAYGLIQFVMEPIFYTLPQMLLDYPLAFGALGLAGFFAGKKHGLQIGYAAGVLGRYVFAVISGVIFFGSYAPEGTPAIIYSLGYNATYLVPEAIVTLILITLPPVAKALGQVKKSAVNE